jgi:hypothetical protein
MRAISPRSIEPVVGIHADDFSVLIHWHLAGDKDELFRSYRRDMAVPSDRFVNAFGF